MQHRQQSSKQLHPQHSNEPTNAAIVDAAYPNPPRLKSPFQPVSNSTSIAPTTSHLPAFNHVGSRRNRSPGRRHRHCAHTDCPVETVSHRFDRLPWISMMDLPPSGLSIDDIADLSQLPSQGPDPSTSHSSLNLGPGLGPVRRRKRSFRSDPLGLTLEHPSSPSITLSTHTNPTLLSTPPTKPRRSRVFHRLMPVFSCDAHNFNDSEHTLPPHFMP